MLSKSQIARLRARLDGIPDDHVATRRDLALEYTRRFPRNVSSWKALAHALVGVGLYSEARVALRRLERLTRDKDPYAVHVRWGQYYYALGDLKRSEHWYRRPPRPHPPRSYSLAGWSPDKADWQKPGGITERPHALPKTNVLHATRPTTIWACASEHSGDIERRSSTSIARLPWTRTTRSR